MNNEFKNTSMQQAMSLLREEQTQENMLAAAEALLNTKVMIPARWDKEPQTDENGQLNFAPDTKISLMVISSDNGMRFFPAFTEMEEVKKFYKDNQVTCLILSLDQYLPFLTSAKDTMTGIVIDPKGINMPFKTDFLEGIRKANKQRLDQNTIHKGQKIHLKNVGKEAQNLEAALISTGFHEPAIRAIYLKERVDDPMHPEKVTGLLSSILIAWIRVSSTGLVRPADQQPMARTWNSCLPIKNLVMTSLLRQQQFIQDHKLILDLQLISVPDYSLSVEGIKELKYRTGIQKWNIQGFYF